MNSDLARHVLEVLWNAGVVEAVVCPGGRNAPFVELLSDPGCAVKAFWHFEERSAAFFALGRARATGKPVAVFTTSGTAAGELLPAAMEAFYSGVPLVLVTADRPCRFRGSGAPQAAEQAGIFGIYAPLAVDLEWEDELELFGLKTSAPVHINVCFEDPNGESGRASGGSQAPEVDPTGALSKFLSQTRMPLVVVGSLDGPERDAVRKFLLGLGAPVYLEGLSGFREDETLEAIRLQVGDGALIRASAAGYEVDGVLRIGGVPTHRLWRDLEDRYLNVPVLSVSRLSFSGLGRESRLCSGDVAALLAAAKPARVGPATELVQKDHELADDLFNRLTDEPESETGTIHSLSKHIEKGAFVFLGNSLPVREWDLAATFENRGFEVRASRGLNGIDGQVSTFLGLCRKDKPNWAILGDLTTLYDLPGAWIVAQLDASISATIVVINNSGGRIFERMFQKKEFLNAHEIGFADWATMWGLSYSLCTDPAHIGPPTPGLRIVELRPDAAATSRFWKAHAEAVK